MNIKLSRDGVGVLEPLPHGSQDAIINDRSLFIKHALSVEVIAAARFQLIAAVGLALMQKDLRTTSIAVFGSGPVAIGCVLELRRLEATDIKVVTRNSKYMAALFPDVPIVPALRTRSASVVIDCADRISDALGAIKAGGRLGILGTPSEGAVIDALTVHRQALTVVGMHELAPPPVTYRQTFADVTDWLAFSHYKESLHQASALIDGTDAPGVYAELRNPFSRKLPPFVIFCW
ncbi:hypothetical protein RMR21_025700 (plasmid) [Agrobacterium sp. rho-8.1]|nr:hypothetical protein [Agrobacterium sp. rho-8.1]